MLHNANANTVPAPKYRAAQRGLAALAIMAWLAAAAARADPAPLRSAVIEGSTVYSPADFFAAYRGQLGRPLDLASARIVAAAIAARYRDDGYARPELRLDESLVAEGILRINVFEPRITRVTMEGTPGRYRDQVELIARGVRDASPLRRDTVPLALSAMRQLPGLSVSATLRPDGAQRNAYDLVLQTSFVPVNGIARMNNRGTDEVGPLFLMGQVESNDLLGWGEKIGVVFAATTSTEEYLSAGLYLDAPLGDAGTRGTAMLYRSDSAPDESPVDLADEYRRERATLRVSRTLRQTAERSVMINGAFEAEDLRVDRDGVDIRDDRLRVLAAGVAVNWQAFDATQWLSSLQLRQGLDAFGAGLRADDLTSDPRREDFLLAQLQFTSLTRLGQRWSVRLDSFAQYSADVLPDSERFKIGGERLGRGFEVAEIAGDQGIGGKLLVRRDLAAAWAVLGRPSVYGFYDFGAAWKQDVDGRESAATLGVGFALQGARLTGYLEAAKPVTHADVEGKRSTTIFADLSVRF